VGGFMSFLKKVSFIKIVFHVAIFISSLSHSFSSEFFPSKSLAIISKQRGKAPVSSELSFPRSIDFSPMPFRLGFEFQEISGLCTWAKTREDIIKKPIFEVYHSSGRKLWHVEIDDVDIEFVTSPFNPSEKEELALAIRTIIEALNILQKEFEINSEITFDEWATKVSKFVDPELVEIRTKETIFETIKDEKITKPHSIRSLPIAPKKDGNIKRALEWKKEELRETTNEKALVIRDHSLLEEKATWKPMFAPQVTIQHPLEDTIPLYFSLFGFYSRNMIRFLSALPFLDWYKQSLKEANHQIMNRFVDIFRQKIHGFIFLHALTMTDMTPILDIKKSAQENDQQLLQETLEAWKKYRQIDAKLKLALMSRRPFSQMYAELGQQNYAHYFEQVMQYNSQFMKWDAVPTNFGKTNYAEQFLNQKKQPLNLSFLGKYFKPKFFQNNQNTLEELLRQGIFSTTMLRNLQGNLRLEDQTPINSIFDTFFDTSLKSVEQPEFRYDLDVSSKSFKQNKAQYDTLSPPWLLPPTNAMGRYTQFKLQDLQYGEALIEVRSISEVHPWFLARAGLSVDLTGDFLKYPSDDTVNQAVGLFDFLSTFRSEENKLEIFYLGLPYAVLKN
jgi:hypothetical protein